MEICGLKGMNISSPQLFTRGKIGSKQDKVNYAVFEREDRVADLTTLIRRTGCTGMYWAANGLY